MNIILKVTDNCNSDCTYCYDKYNRGKCGNMSNTTVNRLLTTLNNGEMYNIIIHGGEPLLYGKSNMINLLEKLSKYNTEFSIQTNGLLLDTEWLNIFEHYNVGCSISVDNSLNRNNQLDVYDLLEIKYPFGVISVIDSSNICMMIDWYKKLVNSGAKSIAFNLVYDCDKSVSADVHFEEFRKFYSYLSTLDYVIERNYLNNFNKYLYNGNAICCSPDTCRYSWLTINPNGVILPCDRRELSTYNLGNINTINYISDAFNTVEYTKYISDTVDLQYNNCKSCDINKFCKTSCFCSHNLLKCEVNELECEYQRNYKAILDDIMRR